MPGHPLRVLALLAAVALIALGASGCSYSRTIARAAGSDTLPDGCPARPAAPVDGGTEFTLTSGGVQRTYYLWLPQDAGTKKTPLILDFHATGSPALAYEEGFSPMAETAPTRGYIVVAPQGSSVGVSIPHWTVPGFGTQPDDVRFAEDVVAQVSSRYCVDPNRVYATGASDGAAMSGFLACRSTMLAAVAPVAGVNLARACPDQPPLSVIAFHGKLDQVAPYDGMPDAELAPAGTFYEGAVDTVMTGWGTRDRCAPLPSQTVVSDDVYLESWKGCAAGVDVELYVATDAGHTYPGGKPWPAYVQSIIGTVDDAGGQTNSISAVKLILDFFDQHVRVTDPA